MTRIPSSMVTSVTLPVIFAETVAWRRAVTYPLASSTDPVPGAWLAARATAVRTAGLTSRPTKNHSPAPTRRSSTTPTREQTSARPRGGLVAVNP